MYLDVSDMYPKMYLGLVWDTCKIHAKYQDTCILLECNRAFKIHLRYIRIHEGYMYPSGYTQDTSRYIRIRILITNPPKLDNKPPRSRVNRPRAQGRGRLNECRDARSRRLVVMRSGQLECWTHRCIHVYMHIIEALVFGVRVLSCVRSFLDHFRRGIFSRPSAGGGLLRARA